MTNKIFYTIPLVYLNYENQNRDIQAINILEQALYNFIFISIFERKWGFERAKSCSLLYL